ncbi:hypothetical protein NQ176_g3475 [Zarea fungicola]|uniref:Uncharacterized protein n=1 Tax=Zarea fungicola TaxID=93591 RepID=A0ACC1NJS4_9HYPO|nr:hypothetical protein NQ176_g3475 [Lecanicillium fungicola]
MADSDNPSTGSKRRRISLACTACRTRKSRCDGRRPTCATCEKLGFDCQFDAPDSSTNIIVQKEYVADLENRLRKVELLLQRHDDLLLGHLSACAPTDNNADNGAHLGASTALRSGGNEIETTILPPLEMGIETEGRTDGLAITFVDEHASAYFGESSNIAFVRYLLGAIASIWGVNKPEQPQVSDKNADDKSRAMMRSEHSVLGPFPTNTQLLATGSRLPASSEMETMIDRYFNTMGLLFSFLHEKTFRQEYHAFKKSGYRTVGKTWLGKLNLIFAISSNIDRTHGKTAKECFEESFVFYRRTMSLCGTSLLQSVSLEIVQLLLLQVLYLQGTPQAGEAWSIHGLLVRSATALGMHNDKIGRQLDPIVREMRVRTWHTIYCLDTVLTATFGRPCSVVAGDRTVRLPEPWLDQDAAHSAEEMEASMCATGFLFHSVQIYRIMGASIETQYKGNIGAAGWQDEDEKAIIHTALGLRSDLERWVTNLPPTYSLLSADSPELKTSSRMNKLRSILTLTGTSKQAMQLAFSCIQSAEAVIGIAVSVLGDGPVEDSNLGVWFFTLHYVFTAALMTCSGMLCAQFHFSGDPDTFIAHCRANLVNAANALQNIDNENPTVKRCVKYIRYLSQLQNNRSSFAEAVPQHSTESNMLDSFSGSELMGMVDLLDDNSGLGPYLAAELFDSSNFDALTMPFQY